MGDVVTIGLDSGEGKSTREAHFAVRWKEGGLRERG
jgi:hypothetical protein